MPKLSSYVIRNGGLVWTGMGPGCSGISFIGLTGVTHGYTPASF